MSVDLSKLTDDQILFLVEVGAAVMEITESDFEVYQNLQGEWCVELKAGDPITGDALYCKGPTKFEALVRAANIHQELFKTCEVI